MSAKIWYDHKHKSTVLQPGDKVYLNLHNRYTVLGNKGRKYSAQQYGPFGVIRPVGRLAYELTLPSHWRVHPIVSIT